MSWRPAPAPPLPLGPMLPPQFGKGKSDSSQRPILRTEGPGDPLCVRNEVGVSPCSGPCTRKARGGKTGPWGQLPSAAPAHTGTGFNQCPGRVAPLRLGTPHLHPMTEPVSERRSALSRVGQDISGENPGASDN